MAEIQFDTISWTLDGNNDIMPLLPPKAFNYPAENLVVAPTVYGYDNQYEGIFYHEPGLAADVRVADNREGSTARVHVENSPDPASVSQVYVARFLQSGIAQTGPQSWTLVGTQTGDGYFDITLSPLTEYQVKVFTLTGGLIGLAVGNTFWITDFASRRRLLMRDRTAKAALRVAHRFGRRVWYKNPAHDHINVWATCEGGFESLGLLGGTTSATNFTLWVPRQTGFPPLEGFMTGASLWVEAVPYAVTVRYDSELPYYAPMFRCDCERYDITVELDGIDPPPSA